MKVLMKFKPGMLKCYFVAGTQDLNFSTEQLLTKLDEALAAGITAFQFREKGQSKLDKEQRINLGIKIKQLCQKYRVPLFIDDDVELAKKINADGIHVGQKDMRIEQVLREVGNKMIIGYSCNTLEQVAHANELAVDYIGVGPVFPTDSKADADPAIGIMGLSKIVKNSSHPVVAIGGINKKNLNEVVQTGCAGIAAISYFTQNNNLMKTVEELRVNF